MVLEGREVQGRVFSGNGCVGKSPSCGPRAFDCSAVAAVHGGGGHRGAASFTCVELPWRKTVADDLGDTGGPLWEATVPKKVE